PALAGARLFPADLLGEVNKSYLSPWRLAHVVALGYLVMTLLSPQSQWLSQAWARGIARCGRHSLEIFCLGTVLSFAGWVVLAEAGAGYLPQALVNTIGIGLLWGTAWILAQRNRDTESFGLVQAVRRQFGDWRSQLQRA